MIDTSPDDVLFNCLPLYHSTGGVVGIGALLVRGGQVVIRRRFSASAFWGDVARESCTLFLYIGELCRFLLAGTEDQMVPAHRLRLCLGNGLRREVWIAFQERFRIPQILEFYAATEGNVSLYNLEGLPGAIGRVPPFLAHRFPVELVRCDPETGEIVRGPDGHCVRCEPEEPGQAIGKILSGAQNGTRLFEGYTDPAATEQKILRDVFTADDVWFCTGDLMRRDKAGYYFFIDRLGDTFRWRGENVSTAQVGDVLAACPGVVHAVVYGVEVPGHEGRAGMATIVTNDAFSAARLHAHLMQHLPDYARPRFLRIRAALDVTGTFKPMKAHLQREGFGPAAAADTLLVSDAEGRFVALDQVVRDRIRRGEFRL
jgi:fatty-acyl-CoA synthase